MKYPHSLATVLRLILKGKSHMNGHKYIKEFIEQYSDKIDYLTKIHDEDFIFQFLLSHPVFEKKLDCVHYYFEDGNKSATKFSELIFDELKVKKNKGTSVLEFASGYGCVTRHLVNKLGPVELVCSDIHTAATEFLSEEIGSPTILSTSEPKNYPSNRKFDIVFALSFFSHMPITTWGEWLEKLFSLVKKNGFLIFTTQGMESRKYHNVPEIPASGFWFTQENSEQEDIKTAEYGQTIVTIDFVVNEVWSRLEAPFEMIRSAYWWEHQDLYVIRKTS